MKVNYQLELTDDQLRAIGAQLGTKKKATRAMVREWLDRLVQDTLQKTGGEGGPDLVLGIDVNTTSEMGRTCGFDHIYPGRALPPEPGTPCYCGARRWGERPSRRR